MKKALLLALAAILLSFNARAFDNQHSYYGITVNTNWNFIDEGIPPSLDSKIVFPMFGFDLGFYMQQQLYSRFVLVSGLKYSFTFILDFEVKDKTSKLSSGIGLLDNHALTIPVKFGYTGDLPRNWTFTVFAGPSLQFDVSTTQSLSNTKGDRTVEDYVNGIYSTNIEGDVNIQSDDLKELKWFDVPLGLGVTFKHKHVGIKAEYEYGLINRSRGGIDKPRFTKWNSHQVSVGIVVSF